MPQPLGANRALIAARPRPASARAKLSLLASQLYATPLRAVISVGLLALCFWFLSVVLPWAVLHAVWTPDAARCQAVRGVGACWGVLREKGGLILWGRYPLDQRWRPECATVGLLVLLAVSGLPRCWRPALAWAWLIGIVVFIGLMAGGWASLPAVETELWGGLPLTLLLTVGANILAFPLAVGLALGRRAPWPALRSLCTIYIEWVRGVPLISVLFMASFMFPLLLPPQWSVNVLLRVLLALALFAAAYLAEIVRGGLQALPVSQSEAAAALGLGYWKTQRLIVLPQAITAVLPGLVNHVIALLKDTSLVTIVSLYELTGALSLALDSDTDWRPFKIEASLAVAALYFGLCFTLSLYGRWLEHHWGHNHPTSLP